MRDIPLPENISSEMYRAFTTIQEVLRDMEVNVYRDRRSLNGLQPGNFAVYQNGNEVRLYTKQSDKLYYLQLTEDNA